tara:strand:+ start:16682 stop:18019 length:1338 start_codon:yes stop_codon:yes gene_type:complete
MGASQRSKSYLNYDVVQGAKKRIKYLYESYDKVVVNFSGGKDSTVMLYTTIEVAKEMGKLPVEVCFVDLEIEGLGTHKLAEEVEQMEEVNMIRYCLPIYLRNSTSSIAPNWYPWNPAEKHLWVRDIPKTAVTTMKNHYFEYDKEYQHPDGLPFKALGVKRAMEMQDVLDLHISNYEQQGLTAISLVGVRCEESMARYGIITRKHNECYISSNQSTAYPIYDWLATDVWKYIKVNKKPYNEEYDAMNKTDFYHKLNKQRIGSIFGEESLRGLDKWMIRYGEYWHRIINRAEGVKTAWRYCNDDIYTGTRVKKVEGMKWSEYCLNALSRMSTENRQVLKDSLYKTVTWHKNQTDYPIPEAEKNANPLTGLSWEFLAKIIIRGDSKGRMQQKTPTLSKNARKRNGLTWDEAVNIYGSVKHKKKYYDDKKKKATLKKLAMAKKGTAEAK